MRINLHIERLVLEGLPVDARQGQQVRSAVKRELTALLMSSGDLHDALRFGGNLHRVQTAGIKLVKETGPASLGKQIAGAVFAGIGR